MAAFRRSILSRAKVLYEHHPLRYSTPPFSHIHPGDDDTDRKQLKPSSKIPNFSPTLNHSQHHCFANVASRSLFQNRNYASPAGCSPVFSRNFSVWGFRGTSADKISSAANVLVDKSVEVFTPVTNEVAFAAADSCYPVTILHYFVDYVRSTGLSWCATIMATTILIKGVQLLILTSLRTFFPLLELIELKEQMTNNRENMSPDDVAGCSARIKELTKKLVSGFLLAVLIVFVLPTMHISFFFAVLNMAEKVPAFKDGGMLWFTDMSTPDSLYIFPLCMAYIAWRKESSSDEKKKRPRIIMECVYMALRITTYSLLPKALFISAITSDMFQLSKVLVHKKINRIAS